MSDPEAITIAEKLAMLQGPSWYNPLVEWKVLLGDERGGTHSFLLSARTEHGAIGGAYDEALNIRKYELASSWDLISVTKTDES